MAGEDFRFISGGGGGGEKIVGSVIRQSNPFPELQEKDTMYNLFEAFSLPVCRLHSF